MTETKQEMLEAKEQSQSTWHDILFVPDHFFFFKTFESSYRTLNKKVYDEAFRQIVENSPFPIEQLFWGIIPSKNNMWIWFAGLKERIQAFVGEIKEDKHILPCGALGGLLAKFNEICILEIDDNYSVIKQGLPVLSTEEKVLNSTSGEQGLSTSHFVLESIRQRHNLDYQVTLTTKDSELKSNEVVVNIPAQEIWAADIRDKEQLALLKRQSQLAWISGVGMKWTCFGLAAMIVFQLILGIGQLSLTFKRSTHRHLNSTAKKIENKDFLIRQMQNMVEQEIRPFELLGLLNELRPNNIYFTTALIDNTHNIVVDAVADNAMAVEAYTKALLGCDQFESVKVSNITASSAGTKFKLLCDFKEKQPAYFLNLKEFL